MTKKQIEIKDRNEMHLLDQHIVFIFTLRRTEMLGKLVATRGKYDFNMVLYLNGFMYQT